MPSTRDIRRRIKSVKNTAQITKAMQMVAASKMRKAQQAALAGHPYGQLLNRVLVSLDGHVDQSLHPLLERREVRKELVLVISTDRGLCGALNTNLFRELLGFDSEKTDFVTVGRKGKQFLARMKRHLIADFELPDHPTSLQTKVISKFCIDRFLAGEADKVTIAYPRYVNTLVQTPTLITMLPISDLAASGNDQAVEGPGLTSEILFEPNATEVLDAILPYYVDFGVYLTVLDTRASEQSARMVAMKNATDNAKSLVKDLTLEYNKIRQASITGEILEIATAQMALE